LQAVQRRLAKGAGIRIRQVTRQGLRHIRQLLERYILLLEKGFQHEEAAAGLSILREAEDRFLMLTPKLLRPPSAE
jgi:hypothetical protein